MSTPAPPDPVAAELGASTPSLAAHQHASRLRSDTWNELKNAATRLARLGSDADDDADEAGLRATIDEALTILEPIETYWAFPGKAVFAVLQRFHARRDARALATTTARIVRALVSHSYRRRRMPLLPQDAELPEVAEDAERDNERSDPHDKPYFELLVIDDVGASEEAALRDGLLAMRRDEDPFLYDIVVVPSFEDALIAALFNHNVQAAVVRYDIPLRSRTSSDALGEWLEGMQELARAARAPDERAVVLGRALREMRPELDLYLVTDASVEETASRASNVFRRVFYRQEDYLELHLSVLRGVRRRYRTPFFNALREYAEQPTGVFHALPISRGKSIVRSHWIRDMARFYGINIFLAETSATSGGLDSLLDPQGPIKEAQEAAARAFGSKKSYFVTNGTSTANKIVAQALLRPDDIVLVDRNCHKSLHYANVLSGAKVIYLDAYPLDRYSIYGGVPLERITSQLRELEAAGKLDRVRLLVLTNCTFDGIVYNPLAVMEACLAIKPDLIFLWDEAWFAFATFSPTYRHRTAMDSARRLRAKLRTPEHAQAFADAGPGAGIPDPEHARVRVYATHSTHKTLTSLRQGSMIHVADQDFHEVEGPFREAYMTHTSTSPNYQILASLDIGRRQAELEGYELVARQVELAMILREKIAMNPRLRRWFRILTIADMVPAEHRASGLEAYYDREHGWNPMADAWRSDEFVLDPTRLTLEIAATGVDGDTFKKLHLMERHGIQVNKTSLNTVLFMTNIGTTRSSVAHLLEVLVELADELDQQAEEESPAERRSRGYAVERLSKGLPPMPDFSRFHARFRDGDTPEGDIRTAWFLATDETKCEYFPLEERVIDEALASGRELVSAGFVTPYPPGFPILVPGEIIEPNLLTYMRELDTKEIHGYRADLGLRVFLDHVLDDSEP